MKRLAVLAVLGVVGGTLSGVAPSNLSVHASGSVEVDEPLIDSLIVKRLPGQSTKSAREWLSETYDLANDERQMIGQGFETIDLAEPIAESEAENLVLSLAENGFVESAELPVTRFALLEPNDPFFEQQWFLHSSTEIDGAANLPGAWDRTTGSSNVTVAVIDTGRLDHPDIVDRLVDGRDFLGNDGDETDPGDWRESGDCGGSAAAPSSWHGTHVAGIIAASADNSIGVSGVAPGVSVQHVRVLGSCGGTTQSLLKAIRWAAGLAVPNVPLNPTPAKVINLSLGSPQTCTAGEQSAIDDAVAAGSVVVVAAGNSGANIDTNGFGPADCDNVISVASVNGDGTRSSFSNYGSAVDVSAPGGLLTTNGSSTGIYSLGNGGTQTATTEWTYTTKIGTSMAAPVVAGVAALLLSVDPTLTPAEIETIITSTARSNPNCPATQCGAGIIDAEMAVTSLPDPNAYNPAVMSRIAESGGIYTTNLEVASLYDRTDVILVSGSTYPDGLAASALAKQEDADIILVPPSGLETAQIAQIVDEAPDKVWIVGGPQAVPDSVITQLVTSTAGGGAGIAISRIERVWGRNRYETAVEVSKRIDLVAYLAAQQTAILVRGDSFADAVIAGPASFGIQGGIGSHPIFLTKRTSIPSDVITEMMDRNITNVLIIGGTAVVSDQVEATLQFLGFSTSRVAGADRYATAAQLGQLLITPIASGGFGWSAGRVGIVDISESSQGFDAISSVGLLGPNRRMLLGVNSSQVPSRTAAYLRTLQGLTTKVSVIGDSSAVPDHILLSVQQLLGL